MFCSECGTQLPDDSVFCHDCGTKTDVGSQAAQRPQAAERPAQTVADTAPPVRPATAARPSAGPARPVANSRSATRPPVAAGPPPPSARYVGVGLVVTTALILGWLIFFLGILGGFGTASQCTEVLDQYECNTEDRLGLFFATLIGAWLAAAFFLWCGYVLRLLSDVEARLRTSGASDQPSGPTA
jgi:hypothetical protein